MDNQDRDDDLAFEVIHYAEELMGEDRYAGAWIDRSLQRPVLGMALVAPEAAQVTSIQDKARRAGWSLTIDVVKYSFFCYLRLAVSTGARRSQLLGLRWGDVDEERAAIAFTRALVEGPDGPKLRSTKTHRTYRVELDAETLAVLVAHRGWAMTRARDVGAQLTVSAFVFSSRPDGAKPWLPNWVTKRFICCPACCRPAALPTA